ncbi:MAG: phage/plasmid replication protein [bacterium]
MIDTLKILIPVDDRKFLEKLKVNLIRTSRKNLETGEMKYEYFTGEIKAGSYLKTISFKISEGMPVGIFFEFSLPKYKYGNNVEMIWPSEVLVILESFRKELCEKIKEELPLLSEWIVYRLDLCYNWTFESKEKCQSLMNFIQRIDYPRKKVHRYETSVMYIGSAYTIKFYLKGDEFLKNSFKESLKVNEEKTYKLLDWANKILRFEVEFRKNYLQSVFGKKKVKISDIADDQAIIAIEALYLDKVFKYINKEKMKHEDVRQRINSYFKPAKAYRLYNFYKGYYFEQDEKYHIEKGLNRSTIFNYKKDLKKIGVAFTENLTSNDFVAVEELIIPSKNAHFTLLAYNSIHTIVSI